MAIVNAVVIGLQFSFASKQAVPQGLRWLCPITDAENEARKERSSGIQYIEPTHDVSGKEIVDQLRSAGYYLYDGTVQQRPDKHNLAYYTVRYLFGSQKANNPVASHEGGFDPELAQQGLKELLEKNLWRVRVFLNPYFRDNKPTREKAVSVNFEVRKPLFEGTTGRRVAVWARNDQGQKLGDAPIPLAPKNTLTMEGGVIAVRAI